MKQTKGHAKRHKFVPCVVLAAAGYLVVWYASFFRALDFTEPGVAETIMIACPAVALAIVGTGLLVVSSRQVVRIVSDGEALEFSFYNGKQIRVEKEEIAEVVRYAHSYVFQMRGGKRLPAFQYIPPKPLTHARKLEETIEELSDAGLLPPITWDGGHGGWR